ncbi:glucuronate isomerase [Winogradskya consettensis]|uniref:Uronate isomerase n=1 Tax=Winogradskya consettensis TaxID=113560 RepID=A0A919SZL0_9ACTN|nr:glucuronate isomerase [Actinoplanes consettensis]GIM82332.1 uronate isomerase [Actinoplanes consettensis]
MAALTLHPDRLLPADPGVRSLARRLYQGVRDLPIISPHGHVDPGLLLHDTPFADPASLFIQPDHYVTRLLHAGGVPLDALGVGEPPMPEARAREAWRLLCAHWDLLRGTPVRYWFDSELAEIFGITSRPSASNADDLYDVIAGQLAMDTHRPRALLSRFTIEFLATTDDPADDLAAHRALRADPAVSTVVAPTFRPDRYLEIGRPGWPLLAKEFGDYAGYIAWLEDRRRYFADHGAVSADHGHLDAGTEPLSTGEASRIYRSALAGTVTSAEATAFRRHMTFEMARMSCDDGLVMTLHPGVHRGHHPPTLHRFGPDTGHDIPVTAEYTRSLQPLLEKFGTHPGFHLVLFTVDPDVYTREIAPLAGFYPSVYAGAPWWFLDNPASIAHFQHAITEIAGLSRLSGFVDDTRAFCSIPARHDMSRRLDAAFLAGLVTSHRLDEDEALDALTALVRDQPRKVFKL